jgi:RNA polymerase sigma-70 factor (ECF subfamily)
MRALGGYLFGVALPSKDRAPSNLSTATTTDEAQREVNAFSKSADDPAASSNSAADSAMNRYADGDDTAFDELHNAIVPRLYGYSVRMVRDVARAEDLVQQTLIKMICGRGGFVKGSRVTPWAFSILRNQLRDQEKRPKIELLSVDGASREERATSLDPLQCTEARQRASLVREQVDQLPPSQRQVCEIVYYGGMTHAEAAEVLDVTVASIKCRLQRANETLRAALRPQDEEG